MKILIDNGHGAETPGKRSPVWADGSQLLEWKYAREVAHMVGSALWNEGISAELIVREDSDVSLSERCKRANEIANKAGIKNCLLVSIHNNAANGKASGWEVHTYLGKSKSDEYATIFWSEAKAILPMGTKMRGDWTDGDPDFDSNFAILRDTACPAVLTENLFMDNPEDCRYLLSSEGKAAIAKIHVQSILKITGRK
ncbi:MAG: N-acetylmuramoyl-L-alanine amidase [Prevotellaceae bacterium]|jgi:N-acetylmuramoyl-L-alanine amidase|nr:N-acetylmuramoyl-L-alanine amidase [Prevotellaceae bacterium]